jgi:hypothetical protein
VSAVGQGFALYDNQEIKRAGSRNNERSSFLILINGSSSNFLKRVLGLRHALMRALPIHPGYGNAQPKVL